ncbi:glutathione peroxidase [Rhodospirillum sp. A1_3_36]|uniref:glutathione peroxidase n=1 Tax=Rhodospirillum sp. A1_3_36 TaxID=3391666 RepID=UPI0039A49BF9
MRHRFSFCFAAFLSAVGFSGPALAETAHDFTFESIDGSPLPLKAWAGRPVLVVNTASRCGFTPQYEGLQALWQRYRDQGLVVLGVPSNDFGGQEPGTESEIKDFCETTFDVDFPLAEKTVVKGEGAHPFYAWARDSRGDLPTPGWNFHKYLVAPDGSLAGAFPTTTDPLSPQVIQAVEDTLSVETKL